MRRLGERAPASPAQGKTDETALATDTAGVLAKYGGFTRAASLAPTRGGSGGAYLGFHSNRSSVAGDVLQALGRVPEGTPYLCKGGEFYNAGDWAFLSLAEFPFWCTLGNDFHPDLVRLTDPGFGAAAPNGDKWKAQVLAILLHLPGQEPLPKALAPAVASLTTFRATKVDAIRGHVDAVERSQAPEWAKQHGETVASAPPRFRVTSRLLVESRTARSGYSYQLAKSAASAISVAQVEAVGLWAGNAAAQEDVDALQRTFDAEVAKLQEKAQG